MKTSPNGIAMIKKFEGLSLVTYQCSAGVWTIGYGHTNKVVPGSIITEQQAEEFLATDLKQFETVICSLVKVPLNQNQFDALVSWTYNLGTGNLGQSTLLKELNAGNYEAVPFQMQRWTKSKGKDLPGLVARRAVEAALFAAPVLALASTSAPVSLRIKF